MTIKLTYDQAHGLIRLFEKVILQELPADIAESLVKDLMISVFKKLRNRIESKLKGDGYSLALSDPEAKAYYLYFHQRHLGKDWIYEQNFIDQQLLLLDKTYA